MSSFISNVFLNLCYPPGLKCVSLIPPCPHNTPFWCCILKLGASFISNMNVSQMWRFLRWGMFCLTTGLGRCKYPISINIVEPNETMCHLHLLCSILHVSLPPIVDGALLARTIFHHGYLGFAYSSCKQESHPNQSLNVSLGVLIVVSFLFSLSRIISSNHLSFLILIMWPNYSRFLLFISSALFLRINISSLASPLIQAILSIHVSISFCSRLCENSRFHAVQ